MYFVQLLMEGVLLSVGSHIITYVKRDLVAKFLSRLL